MEMERRQKDLPFQISMTVGMWVQVSRHKDKDGIPSTKDYSGGF